jgi:hypothetical protein
VQTTNGGTAGRPDAGDTVVFTYAEPIDPISVLAAWTGTATPVQVVITNSITDLLTVRTSNGVTQLPLSSLNTKGDYVSATTTYNATMVRSGSAITVTLGTVISGTPHTATFATALSWTTGSTAGATDRAGNTLTSSTVTETGVSDIDF